MFHHAFSSGGAGNEMRPPAPSSTAVPTLPRVFTVTIGKKRHALVVLQGFPHTHADYPYFVTVCEYPCHQKCIQFSSFRYKKKQQCTYDAINFVQFMVFAGLSVNLLVQILQKKYDKWRQVPGQGELSFSQLGH